MIVNNISEQGIFILVVCLALLVLGLIMETLSLILIMMPIFAVSIAAMNIDLIWFGIIFTLMIECALITPPVGLNIYVLQAIGNAKTVNMVFGLSINRLLGKNSAVIKTIIVDSIDCIMSIEISPDRKVGRKLSSQGSKIWAMRIPYRTIDKLLPTKRVARK